MDKRHQRMLEEVLKIPGNEACADCRAPAPRWASVNIGIFLCVGCASVHRKMGTHKSRVKSVTLDDWSRDQITHMRSIGNTAANLVWNPNASLHPPPTATGADERDSEMEKYIRRKYELGAFKAGSTSGNAPAPTSLNRARERDGRLPFGSLGSSSTGSSNGGEAPAGGRENWRNPELNDVLVRKEAKERDLPALPISANSTGVGPRSRPTPSRGSSGAGTPALSTSSASASVSGSGPGSGVAGSLIDLSGGTSGTLPLQISGGGQHEPNGVPYGGINGMGGGMIGQGAFQQSSQQSQGWSSLRSQAQGQQQHLIAFSAPSTSTMAMGQGWNPFLQQQQQQQQQHHQVPQTAFASGSFQQRTPFPAQQQQPFSHFQHPSQSQQALQGNGFGTMQQVQSPWGESAGSMGMHHAAGGALPQGYFPPQGSVMWNGAGTGTGGMGGGMEMNMGMNMNMGMAQGGYGNGMMR